MGNHLAYRCSFDTADNNAIKLETGKTVTLRESPYTSDLYTLGETVPALRI
jgi:hypothetical protein